MLPKFTVDPTDPANITFTDTPLHKIWPQLEILVEKGLVRSIGVSNCAVPMLVDLLTYAKIKPVMNQVELHPYLSQKDFVDFARNKLGVQFTAFSPIGAPGFEHKSASIKELNLITDPTIVEIGTKYGRSPA